MNCFSPVMRPAARSTWSSSRFFMELSDLRLRQKSHVRHRLPQSHGLVIVSKHRSEQHPVVVVLRDSAPLVVGRYPSTLQLPAVEIRENLRTYFPWRTTAHHGK